MDFNIVNKNNYRYIVIPELEERGLSLCFTTIDMDIGLKTNKNIEDINRNFDRIFEFMGRKPLERFSGYQTHLANIVIIKDPSEGSDYPTGRIFYDTDGLITNIKDIALISRFADCTPIILFDPVKGVQGNIHSGWKGTLQRIAEVGVRKMVNEYGSKTDEIIAIIGPTIGKEDFEVQADVMTKFRDEFLFHKNIIEKKDDIKYLIDLPKTNTEILLDSGIKLDNIFNINMSTLSNKDIFHSYRRDGLNFGLMGAISIL